MAVIPRGCAANRQLTCKAEGLPQLGGLEYCVELMKLLGEIIVEDERFCDWYHSVIPIARFSSK
jgi:hypothetical protein